MIQVCSVNIGKKQSFDMGDRQAETGIFKQSVAEPVLIGSNGLAGDQICDSRYHGGPDQAVYIYRVEDYEWWASELNKVILPGTFGENLTLKGLDSPQLFVGDRLDFGDLVLEVTAPRIPCGLFARRMGDPGFVKRFLKAERPGFYCRVIAEGAVSTQSELNLIKAKFESISTLEFYRDVSRRLSTEKIEQYLSLPIDARSRKDFEKKLASRSKAN
ncbi:MAG: MOSC domain-containing protein YiiM [Candidatus Azotimanducaceae bacterium]|jgi:MOSC domain-containing protein YiiM